MHGSQHKNDKEERSPVIPGSIAGLRLAENNLDSHVQHFDLEQFAQRVS
jgi:hypothetical protein